MSKKTKKTKRVVYVLTAESESDDHYGPYVLAKKPTDKELELFWRERGDWGDEDDEGPGDWGSWMYTRCEEVEVLEIGGGSGGPLA